MSVLFFENSALIIHPSSGCPVFFVSGAILVFSRGFPLLNNGWLPYLIKIMWTNGLGCHSYFQLHISNYPLFQSIMDVCSKTIKSPMNCCRSICNVKKLHLHVHRSGWQSIIDGVSFITFSFLKKFPIVLSLSFYCYLLTKLFLFVILISPDTLDQLEVHEDVFGKNAKYLQGRCFYCTCSFLFIYYLWYNANFVSFLKKIEIANEHGIYTNWSIVLPQILLHVYRTLCYEL